MVSSFRHLHHVTQICANLNDADQIFPDFSNKHIFYDDDHNDHLLIPVYSGIKPSMGTESILNKLLSLVRFYTESGFLLNDTLRGCFRNAKLIREEDNPGYLQNYSNQVINIFVNNQLVCFSNDQHMIEAFTIQAGDLLDSVVINNESDISEMP